MEYRNYYDGPSYSHVNSQDYAVVEENDRRVADDFVVPARTSWTIERVDVNGDYESYPYGYPVARFGPAASVQVTIFRSDVAGTRPAAELGTWDVVPAAGLDTGNFVLPLDPPLTVGSGRYWIAVASVQNEVTNGTWWWSVAFIGVANSPAALQWQNCPNWCAPAPGGPYDVQYRLAGTSLAT